LATSKLCESTQNFAETFKFIFGGTQLMDKNEFNQDITIGFYNIQKECVVHYLLIVTQKLDLKVYIDGQTRRFEIDQDEYAFTQLLKRLEEIYPAFIERMRKNKYLITYQDNEGDAVTVSTDRDFRYYLNHKQSWNNDKMIRLWITKTPAAEPKANVASGNLSVGQIINLKSVSSGQYLRINADGRVDGLGIIDDRAKFKVASEKKNADGFQTVKLQSVADNKKWLRIENEMALNGLGLSGALCEFVVIRNSKVPDRVSLRSVAFPKCHVGILSDGSPKAPKQTGTGDNGSFLLSVTK